MISTKTLNAEHAKNKRSNNSLVTQFVLNWTNKAMRISTTNVVERSTRKKKTKHSLFWLYSMFTPKFYLIVFAMICMIHTTFLFCWFYGCSVLIINLKMTQCENVHNERAFKLIVFDAFLPVNQLFFSILAIHTYGINRLNICIGFEKRAHRNRSTKISNLKITNKRWTFADEFHSKFKIGF